MLSVASDRVKQIRVLRALIAGVPRRGAWPVLGPGHARSPRTGRRGSGHVRRAGAFGRSWRRRSASQRLRYLTCTPRSCTGCTDNRSAKRTFAAVGPRETRVSARPRHCHLTCRAAHDHDPSQRDCQRRHSRHNAASRDLSYDRMPKHEYREGIADPGQANRPVERRPPPVTFALKLVLRALGMPSSQRHDRRIAVPNIISLIVALTSLFYSAYPTLVRTPV